MTTQGSFPTTMTIEKVSAVEGRDGGQWELQVKWPWTNEYPDKIWLDQATFEMPKNGAHNVLIHKAGYKKKKDGGYYDGNQGWMFNYRLDSFGGEGASPNGHTGAPSSRDDIFRSKEELRWTEAMHIASSLLAGSYPPGEGLVGETIEMAERLYQALEAGYPHLPQVPTEAPAPEHYCQEHGEPYIQGSAGANGSPGRWGHRLGDGWCMDTLAEQSLSQRPHGFKPEDLDDLPF